MEHVTAVFLDDGGVLSDNTVRSLQWQHLVGEFFVPVLGGTYKSWAEANFAVITDLLESSNWSARLEASSTYAAFIYRYRLDWLASMCEMVGVAMPPDREALALAETAERWIRPQVSADFPGAVEAVRMLHAAGCRLFTASGESSEDLDDYLRGMAVRECFERLYGPDLVETFKAGPEYYARIFADAGVSAEDALVVDDSSTALRWASEAGAATVLVRDATGPFDATYQIPSVRDLFALIPLSPA